MNMIKMEDKDLRNLESIFRLKHESLILPKEDSRLMVAGEFLAHEIPHELKWHWWGYSLRVWNAGISVESLGPRVTSMRLGSTHFVCIAEEGKTHAIGKFLVTSKTAISKGDDPDYVMYELKRKWFKS